VDATGELLVVTKLKFSPNRGVTQKIPQYLQRSQTTHTSALHVFSRTSAALRPQCHAGTDSEALRQNSTAHCSANAPPSTLPFPSRTPIQAYNFSGLFSLRNLMKLKAERLHNHLKFSLMQK